MKHLTCAAICAMWLIGAASLSAQETAVFEVKHISENVYRLVSNEGAYTTNVLVFVGDDGLLLVDSNTEENAAELKRVIDSLWHLMPTYIINTHRHVEHVGGNAIFGFAPIVIAHTLLPQKLRSGSYIFNEFPAETFPDITFSDSLTLHFNGEDIRLIALGGSHDDNEIIVHFTKSKVVHLSSLINGMNFPSIDADGSALMFDSLVGRAVALLPEDVTIVSGHNDLATWQDLHTYRDMIRKTLAIVRDGLAAGKDVETLQNEKALADFERFNHSYVSPEEWIEYLAEAIEHETNPQPPKKKVHEDLYYALRDEGIQQATDTYFRLKADTTYKINDYDLLVIGDKLLGKDRTDAAIAMLKLYVQEHPEGDYVYYAHFDIATAYKKLDDKELALEHCAKAIELKPEFAPAQELKAELDQM